MERIWVQTNFRVISVFQNEEKHNHNLLKINGLQKWKDFQSFIFCKPLIINSVQIHLERDKS